MKYIKFFGNLSKNDINLVGGKNANLGEMYQKLSALNIRVPNGFAVTTEAYDYFIETNNLKSEIERILSQTDIYKVFELSSSGEKIRNLIKEAELPENLKGEIISAFNKLKEEYGGNITVAVRSSASAEDLPDASFAGQQDTYLNVTEKDILEKIKYLFCFFIH
ncbi:MAG: hypothetical protein KatS3mg095_0656 [Candidatus Parcubacteria bacterium]|nr:MAG: hypothetical protein KatS3mg095_0656 [Candidatus Parcubacteria bacterium]